MAIVPENSQSKEAWIALKEAAASSNSLPERILELYWAVAADMIDFEEMYFCCFGWMDSDAGEAFTAQVRTLVEPNQHYHCSWWANGG